ncbi:hypothetical protein M758_11G114000 [Ceratodon purpureus]|nr:hypothetical protein M758_11G114000 [Ceratodon purpureus]
MNEPKFLERAQVFAKLLQCRTLRLKSVAGYNIGLHPNASAYESLLKCQQGQSSEVAKFQLLRCCIILILVQIENGDQGGQIERKTCLCPQIYILIPHRNFHLTIQEFSHSSSS